VFGDEPWRVAGLKGCGLGCGGLGCGGAGVDEGEGGGGGLEGGLVCGGNGGEEGGGGRYGGEKGLRRRGGMSGRRGCVIFALVLRGGWNGSGRGDGKGFR